MNDMIRHPKHYVSQSVPLEPIDILRFAPFDLGCALKYIIRAGFKDPTKELEDWQKAEFYLETALYTREVNPKPYDDFFTYYGFMLQKFERLSVEFDPYLHFDQAIEILLEYVKARIEVIKNGSGKNF